MDILTYNEAGKANKRVPLGTIFEMQPGISVTASNIVELQGQQLVRSQVPELNALYPGPGVRATVLERPTAGFAYSDYMDIAKGYLTAASGQAIIAVSFWFGWCVSLNNGLTFSRIDGSGRRIAYGNDMFVSQSSNSMFSSTDGMTWQDNGNPAPHILGGGVTYFNGAWYMSSYLGQIWTSANGVNWSYSTAIEGWSGFGWLVANDTHMYHFDGGGVIRWSTDGVNWTIIGGVVETPTDVKVVNNKIYCIFSWNNITVIDQDYISTIVVSYAANQYCGISWDDDNGYWMISTSNDGFYFYDADFNRVYRSTPEHGTIGMSSKLIFNGTSHLAPSNIVNSNNVYAITYVPPDPYLTLPISAGKYIKIK